MKQNLLIIVGFALMILGGSISPINMVSPAGFVELACYVLAGICFAEVGKLEERKKHG